MKFKSLVMICGLAFCLTATPAPAGPLEDGVAAFEKGDYATSLNSIRPLANRGDAVAQYKVGYHFHKGHGVPQDYAEALTWFRRAANQGYSEAQAGVGYMYLKGQGVPAGLRRGLQVVPQGR